MDKVLIFDTTLRDGEQALPASLSVREKLVIAEQLARLKVDIIEAGFPVSSPGDFESVNTIAKNIKGPVICGLARAIKKDIVACWDAIKVSERPRIHTFIGTSDQHLKTKFRKDKSDILKMAVDAVKFARNKCDNVEFSSEDTGRTERDFLLRIVEDTIKAGATTINLPDTVGYTYPEEYVAIIDDVFNNVPNIDKVVVSVHCHNDLGMAVANSITAAKHGVRQIECAMNGIGERAGNTALEEVVMFLKVRKSLLKLETNINTRELHNTSRLVTQICNMPVQPNKAVVGSNAFAHSSGIHQDGILKSRSNYEIMTPATVGLKETKMNLTSRSGRAMIKNRLISLGYSSKHMNMDKIYTSFLELADKKGTVYDDDLQAMMEFGKSVDEETYKLLHLNATAGTGTIPTATIRIETNGKQVLEAATGDGPVDASYNAIDLVTGIKVRLENYKLNSVTEGRDSLGEVHLMVSYKGNKYHGVASSTDVVEASAKAYLNAVNKIAFLQVNRLKKKKRNAKTK